MRPPVEDGASREPVTAQFARLNLVGRSPVFQQTLRLIARVAACDATVLIQGETGTGKELAARAIHYLGSRRDCAFIPVNCGALPDGLLESELFGHERGAFTDAKQSHDGLVAQAQGGTLFLDEVEAMTPRAQIVLLRFLQDHTYRPVGGRAIEASDVRVVASSNADLEQLVAQDRFRSDLLFRLGVLSVTMPPLRMRGSDVVVLAEEFLRRFSVQYGRPVKTLHPGSIAWLTAHEWPGNVRELENLMLRELVLGDGDTIRLSRKPGARIPAWVPPTAGVPEFNEAFKAAKARAVAQFECAYVSYLLAKTRGNVSLAARLSRKDRSAFTKLVRKHGFNLSQFRAGASSSAF